MARVPAALINSTFTTTGENILQATHCASLP